MDLRGIIKPGDKLEVLRDLPWGAQVKAGDIVTVIRLQLKSISIEHKYNGRWWFGYNTNEGGVEFYKILPEPNDINFWKMRGGLNKRI